MFRGEGREARAGEEMGGIVLETMLLLSAGNCVIYGIACFTAAEINRRPVGVTTNLQRAGPIRKQRKKRESKYHFTWRTQSHIEGTMPGGVTYSGVCDPKRTLGPL
jgi:hypothetical protein